jgi:hypothetical protein
MKLENIERLSLFSNGDMDYQKNGCYCYFHDVEMLDAHYKNELKIVEEKLKIAHDEINFINSKLDLIGKKVDKTLARIRGDV